ncbi:hypothetical protein [Antrihabitans sp. YC2-6]|uniref:hypothetical protein n=1 Tax=Antrihabitans sp. YC2-6 TaxID=2799498 RepID=UPI0018F32AF3|nr:hypothetical protein [Antrihabitans sp. YC2-6]MBJ8344835.1 hypothetical protein [Antrihabitans sp. YC2-6]
MTNPYAEIDDDGEVVFTLLGMSLATGWTVEEMTAMAAEGPIPVDEAHRRINRRIREFTAHTGGYGGADGRTVPDVVKMMTACCDWWANQLPASR